MKHRAPSLFDLERQFDKTYALNNFLPKLKQIFLWEIFLPTYEPIHHKERLSNAVTDKHNESREWIAAQ